MMYDAQTRDGSQGMVVDGDEKFAPDDFLRLGLNPDSITARGARLFKTDVRQFVSWRWQMAHQISTLEQAVKTIDLEAAEEQGFDGLDEIFNAGITPYYLSLARSKHDDQPCPIRLQAIPRLEELTDSVGVADPLLEKEHSPVKEVVHLYPDRVAFCVAMLCPVYCRYCYRKRRDGESGLHFNRTIIDRGIDYIASNPAIKDVLITGGDPFIASDTAIENLLERLRGIPHVEIIRFGTRTPVTLPYRVTKSLAVMIAKYHPVFVNTHFNCPEELTPEAKLAVSNLIDAGIPVGNQSVLLRGVNDDYQRMHDLLSGLLRFRVKPYYLFHPHNVEGTEHLRPSLNVGLRIMKKLRGNITGFAIPQYIVDTPSGKVPVGHNHILGQDGGDLILEDVRGEIWREKGVF